MIFIDPDSTGFKAFWLSMIMIFIVSTATWIFSYDEVDKTSPDYHAMQNDFQPTELTDISSFISFASGFVLFIGFEGFRNFVLTILTLGFMVNVFDKFNSKGGSWR